MWETFRKPAKISVRSGAIMLNHAARAMGGIKTGDRVAVVYGTGLSDFLGFTLRESGWKVGRGGRVACRRVIREKDLTPGEYQAVKIMTSPTDIDGDLPTDCPVVGFSLIPETEP